MAGYLVSIGGAKSDEEAIKILEPVIRNGVYSTNMHSPSHNSWRDSHEGTFADYFSMKENDYIFFFARRKIYGCGKLKKLGSDCKYLNYTDAGLPHGDASDNFSRTRLLDTSSDENRCFCIFEPFPAFFKKGIDMDAVLQNRSNPFRSIRTFWNLSFIKMDDEESKALFDIIIKENEEYIENTSHHFNHDSSCQNKLERLISYDYLLKRDFLISSCKSDNTLKHEMALEAAMCEILTKEDRYPFGKWDYISHQVAASPFKPVDYMDMMDIFGYRYIPNYKIKSKYLIAELKKDAASIDIVEQIMKYVDWVANEYANKDYSMIEAYLVAADFSSEVIDLVKKNCIRNYTKGVRPAEFRIWNNLKLVRYRVQEDDIEFVVVE